MKRCGPPMIDRRLKRKQTRHEVERAAVEDQVGESPLAGVLPIIKQEESVKYLQAPVDFSHPDTRRLDLLERRRPILQPPEGGEPWALQCRETDTILGQGGTLREAIDDAEHLLQLEEAGEVEDQ